MLHPTWMNNLNLLRHKMILHYLPSLKQKRVIMRGVPQLLPAYWFISLELNIMFSVSYVFS